LPVPGWHSFYTTRLIPDDNIQLKAGETKSLNLTLTVKNDIHWPEEFSWEVYLVGSEYDENELSMPAGLEISMEPSRFTAYPNTIYNLKITVTTTTELAPGQYSIRYQSYLGGHSLGKGTITVNIEE